MPRNRIILILACLILNTMHSGMVGTDASEASRYPINGPRLDEVLFVYHSTPEAAVAAIRKGDIDVLSDISRPSDVRALSEDPNLNIIFSHQTHYCYVAFNTRREPLSDRNFRKALAHLIPREEIASKLFEGVVVTPMLYEASPAFGKWHNPDVATYPYDPSRSRRILALAGYGWDKDSRLIGPDGKAVRRLSFISPTQEEAPTSYEIAKLTVEEMKRVGLDAYQEPVSFDSLLTRILTERNFDIYFLCGSILEKYPRWLYEYYHSSLDVPEGENTPGVRDPELDRLLYTFRFESETEDEAEQAIWKAQEMIADIAARIPVYSRYQIEAYRRGWEGMIKHRGVGYFTSGAFWTYLNLSRVGLAAGGVVKVDVGGKVRTLNPLYGAGAYEQKIITLIYDSLLASDPQTGDPIPYLAEGWKLQNVRLGNSKGQKITFNLARNVTWHDGEPFTSADVRFSMEYLKQNKVPIFMSSLERVIEVSDPDPYTLEVTMNGTSFFNLIDVGGIIIIPRHIWKDVSDWRTFQPDRESHPKVKGLTKMVGTGPFILIEEKPGEFWRLRANPNYFKRLTGVRPQAEEVRVERWIPDFKVMTIITVTVMLVLSSYFILRRVSRKVYSLRVL
ncbi:MAG: ABC transporter substrate-binding protein [Candidatus Bathyarchaeia archaeon]